MKKHIYGILLTVGGLSALGFQPYSLIPVLCMTFSVLFGILNRCVTKKQFWMTGFCFGAGLGACALFWVTNALMIDANAFGWAIPLVPIGFGLFFGVFYGTATLLCYKAPSGWGKLCAFAGALTVMEWARSWIFTGFPWNTLGAVWTAFPPVLQSAAVGGVFGLTFISVFWFCSPVFLFQKRWMSFGVLAVSFVLIAGAGAIRLATAEKAVIWGVTVRLVQPNIPQTLKWDADSAEDNLMQHIRLSKSKGADKITHVIWSEAATPFILNQDEAARAMTISALHQEETLITGSLRRVDEAHLSNSVLVINDVGQIVSYYDKSHLVPFGEYVPFRNILPMEKLVPIASDFKAGAGPKTIRIPGAPPAGLLVCYEIIFPGRVADSRHRPDWLINVTNDGWYGISAGPYQHLAAAQLRAAEEGLPVVRVAGSGISAVIDPYGRIVKSLPLGVKGVLDSAVPQKIAPPFYTFYHNGFALLAALMSWFLGMFSFRSRKEY